MKNILRGEASYCQEEARGHLWRGQGELITVSMRFYGNVMRREETIMMKKNHISFELGRTLDIWVLLEVI